MCEVETDGGAHIKLSKMAFASKESDATFTLKLTKDFSVWCVHDCGSVSAPIFIKVVGSNKMNQHHKNLSVPLPSSPSPPNCNPCANDQDVYFDHSFRDHIFFFLYCSPYIVVLD